MNKILARLRYPKLFLLILSIVFGFLIYFDQNNFHFHELINQSGYWGIFIGGILLAPSSPGVLARRVRAFFAEKAPEECSVIPVVA